MTFTKNDLINSIKFYKHLDKKKLYHLFKVYKSLNISDNIVETIIKLKRKKNPYHFIKKLHLKYKVLKDLKGGYFDPNANLNPNSPNLIQPNPNNFETIPLIPQNFSPQLVQPQPIQQQPMQVQSQPIQPQLVQQQPMQVQSMPPQPMQMQQQIMQRQPMQVQSMQQYPISPQPMLSQPIQIQSPQLTNSPNVLSPVNVSTESYSPPAHFRTAPNVSESSSPIINNYNNQSSEVFSNNPNVDSDMSLDMSNYSDVPTGIEDAINFTENPEFLHSPSLSLDSVKQNNLNTINIDNAYRTHNNTSLSNFEASYSDSN